MHRPGQIRVSERPKSTLHNNGYVKGYRLITPLPASTPKTINTGSRIYPPRPNEGPTLTAALT